MIQRQRCNGDDVVEFLVGRALPHDSLLHIAHHVAVTEHGALGDPGSATRVLQERDVGKADINDL